MNKVILFLHGYGANGNDLIGLKDHIENKDNSILFESPNAPESCPLNYFGYQWFNLAERTPEEIYSGLKKSYKYLYLSDKNSGELRNARNNELSSISKLISSG